MHDDEGQAKLGYRGGVIPRPKSLIAKVLGVVLGSAVLVGAFVVSIAFLAIALALVLACGAYLWWKTRDLRRRLHEQMQEVRRADTRGNVNGGDVIEGVVISRKETSDHSRR